MYVSELVLNVWLILFMGQALRFALLSLRYFTWYCELLLVSSLVYNMTLELT